MKKLALFLFVSLTFGFQFSYARSPKVGKKAAARYFQGEMQASVDPQAQTNRTISSNETVAAEDHFLTLGFSNYLSSDSYRWGQSGSEEKVGKWGVDMMYRIGQYSNTIDQALRISYNEFDVQNYRASKLSFLYAITLPDAGSQFPFYFGAALGAGVFLKQLQDESPLSLDYQLYLGLRLFNVVDNTGFYIEGGLKNHLQLTSDGQLNGSFVSAGAVFTF